MTIKPEVVEAIVKQINREREATVVYESLAIWCEANDYSGFATFFTKQAAEEREHVDKFVKHLLSRQAQPKLGAIQAPPADFENVLDVAETALEHEQGNTQGILETRAVAEAAKDYAALVLLDWFVSEQVEEEAWANKMVTLAKRMSSCSCIYHLDRHIEKDLGVE